RDQGEITVNERNILEKYHLPAKDYIFNGSGFNIGKGTSELVELTRRLRAHGRDLLLVIAGKKRLWTSEMEKAFAEGWLRPLGTIPTTDVQALGALAWLDANLSTIDSFPRHSLEVIARGGRVLLPPGVPEFEDFCRDHVAKVEEGYDALAEQA